MHALFEMDIQYAITSIIWRSAIAHRPLRQKHDLLLLFEKEGVGEREKGEKMRINNKNDDENNMN